MQLSTKTIGLLGALAIATLAPAAPARAQSLNQLGIQRTNADAQTLWAADGLPMARAEALKQLQKLVGVPHQIINGQSSATIIAVHSVTINAPAAPGLTRCDGSQIAVACPLSGTWTLGASVRVRAKGKILGIPFDDSFNVAIDVTNFRASGSFDLDSSNPAAPRVVRMNPLAVSFQLKITSANAVMRFLNWITSGFINPVITPVAHIGSAFLAQQIGVRFQGSPAIVGEAAALAPVAPADLQGSALKIEDEIEQFKMPWGSVTEGWFDQEFRGTWEDSLKIRRFHPGQLDLQKLGTFGDSALMTGYHLGGVVFRYATTRAPDALARAKRMLATTRTLLTMKGEPGNLNRSICPMRPDIQLSSDQYVQRFNGVDYVMSDYISRDAYTGIFYGLATAQQLLDDPAAKADAGQQIEMALDYLLRNNWTWRKRDGSYGERWAGVHDQQLAWVLAAHRANPAKYQAALDSHKGLADLAWVGVWTAAFDPFFQYYKFSLSTSALHILTRSETDPVRFQREYQSIAILRHFIGHHQQAQFNNCYLAADAGSRAALGAENANLLTRWLRAPRRYMIWDLRNDPTIEKITYTMPLDLSAAGYAQSVVIAKKPIPVEKRVSAGYRWSRSPMTLKEDFLWNAEPTHEGEAVCFTLPYWQSRYYGAIPAPRPVLTAGTATQATTAAVGASR